MRFMFLNHSYKRHSAGARESYCSTAQELRFAGHLFRAGLSRKISAAAKS